MFTENINWNGSKNEWGQPWEHKITSWYGKPLGKIEGDWDQNGSGGDAEQINRAGDLIPQSWESIYDGYYSVGGTFDFMNIG